MKNSIKLENVECTALFIDNPTALLKMFQPKHKNVFVHHSTNWYKPLNLNDLEVGNKSILKIIGRASDQKGDALLVENTKSKNMYPHITISCADGIPPVYSNELLERATKDGLVEIFQEPFYVEVTEGYGDLKDNIITSKK